jgi:hypothetical protein
MVATTLRVTRVPLFAGPLDDELRSSAMPKSPCPSVTLIGRVQRRQLFRSVPDRRTHRTHRGEAHPFLPSFSQTSLLRLPFFGLRRSECRPQLLLVLHIAVVPAAASFACQSVHAHGFARPRRPGNRERACRRAGHSGPRRRPSDGTGCASVRSLKRLDFLDMLAVLPAANRQEFTRVALHVLAKNGTLRRSECTALAGGSRCNSVLCADRSTHK